MNETQRAYLAATINQGGRFSNQAIYRGETKGRTVGYSYRLKSVSGKGTAAIHQLGKIIGLEDRVKTWANGSVVFSVSGDELHDLMRACWDLLTIERKGEYAAVRRASEASKLGGE